MYMYLYTMDICLNQINNDIREVTWRLKKKDFLVIHKK